MSGSQSSSEAVQSDIMSRPRVGENRRAIIGAAIGNAFEWYDFSVYSYLTPVLSVVFFPSSDPVISVLSAFAVFAVGFGVRPIGSLVFGHVADKWGRKVSLVAVIAMMGGATLLIGFLPSYGSAGVVAPVLLVLLRVLQGLAAGGEFGVSATSLVEFAPQNRRGLVGSFAYATVFYGSLLGGGFALVLSNTLTTSQLHSWGWRIPFLASVLLLGIAVYLRRRMPETREFIAAKRAHATAKVPVVLAVRRFWRQMLIIIGLNACLGIVNYTVLSFMQSYLVTILHYNLTEALGSVLVAVAIYGVLVLIFGFVSDKIGRKPVIIGACVCAVVSTFPGFLLLASGNIVGVIVGQIIVGLPAVALCGAIPAAFSEMFPAGQRVSGFGVAYNIGAAIFGGTTPFVLTLLVDATNSHFAPAWYLVASGLFSMVFAVLMRETLNRRERIGGERASDAEGGSHQDSDDGPAFRVVRDDG